MERTEPRSAHACGLIRMASVVHRAGDMSHGTVILSIVLPFLVITVACGTTSETHLAGPGAPRCAVAMTGASSLPSTQSQASLQISTDPECTWNASATAAWLQLSPRNGQGNGTLNVAAAANPSTTPRTATIIINDQSFR